MPTYNRLPHLKKCLDSIIGKFGKYPYEVIVADGGSTDGTIEYLRKNKSKNLVLIEQGKLTGITKAYNESFKIAKGNCIYIGNDDIEVVPETFIKACKFMEKNKQIGMVSAKTLEPRHNNMFGIPSRIREYGMLLSYFHIFRDTVLKDEMNYFDERFRSYRIDTDSSLAVLKRGHTIITTKDVAVIHHRVHDEGINIARSTNEEEIKKSGEDLYFDEKWKIIEERVQDYFKKERLLKKRSLFFNRIYQTMYYADWITPYIKKKYKFAVKIYNWALDNTIIFKDENFDNLDDFHLAQKYPEEIIN